MQSPLLNPASSAGIPGLDRPDLNRFNTRVRSEYQDRPTAFPLMVNFVGRISQPVFAARLVRRSTEDHCPAKSVRSSRTLSQVGFSIPSNATIRSPTFTPALSAAPSVRTIPTIGAGIDGTPYTKPDRKRDRECQYDVHERSAEHDEKLLPSRAKLVKLRLGNFLVVRVAAFERCGRLVAVEFDVRTERDRGDPIVGMTDLKSPDPRTETEERVRLDAHSEQLGDNEMAELVDIDGNTQNKNDGKMTNNISGINSKISL